MIPPYLKTKDGSRTSKHLAKELCTLGETLPAAVPRRHEPRDPSNGDACQLERFALSWDWRLSLDVPVPVDVEELLAVLGSKMLQIAAVAVVGMTPLLREVVGREGIEPTKCRSTARLQRAPFAARVTDR
jgi:hypothetical protein